MYATGALDPSTPAWLVPRPTLLTVLSSMRAFARKDARQPPEVLAVRQAVHEACGGLVSGDYASEVLAIYQWVCQNIRYMPDPDDVEMLQEPFVLLRTRQGDCDCIATLLASMLLVAGKRCVFTVVSFASNQIPSHVLVQVHTPGGLVVLDPVANVKTASMLARKTWSSDFEV